MEYLKIEGEFPKLANCAVTMGKFDGIHRGHRKLVEKIRERKTLGEQAVLFAIDASSNMILTSQERASLLEKLGVDVLVECQLDDRIRHMKAENFIKEILMGDLGASYVVVGEDNRFGFERKGTPKLLEEFGSKYGFEVEILSKEMDGRRKISSTFIREELKKGKMEKVSSLMGADYFVEGQVVHGRGMGHKVLLPTTNLVPPKSKILPPNGVYVTSSYFGEKVYHGITNIGYKPTVGESFVGVETYLFDCEEDLYGENCRVDFKKFLRPERKFSSLEALKARQMPKMAGLILMREIIINGRNHTWINGRTGTFPVWNAPDERQPGKGRRSQNAKYSGIFYQDSPSWDPGRNLFYRNYPVLKCSHGYGSELRQLGAYEPVSGCGRDYGSQHRYDHYLPADRL